MDIWLNIFYCCAISGDMVIFVIVCKYILTLKYCYHIQWQVDFPASFKNIFELFLKMVAFLCHHILQTICSIMTCVISVKGNEVHYLVWYCNIGHLSKGSVKAMITLMY